ncbi:restriction endonuclease subunit S [Oscillibacter sp. 1-3]|jgi:hypothetical protein|uniref:restriction endonuclease subunit S n=1 Tax=Oscillibacter sp. 1-3 TaxID=1235797 RepID=UPI0003A983DF|nr:restriction endonuclease subunit S [Oscillibacter sp. 1-3]
MARLGDIFTISSGGTPDKRQAKYYENGTIPWVKTGDLKEKYVSHINSTILLPITPVCVRCQTGFAGSTLFL